MLKDRDRNKSASIRVVVAGDTAVGKTALIEMICNGPTKAHLDHELLPQRGGWTCGCALSIVHESVEVNNGPIDVEVELWEIGGSRTYSIARSVFYEGMDALLLVYDVSNIKSYHNLVVWLFELCTSVWPPSLRFWDASGGSGGAPDADIERGKNNCTLEQAILTGRCPVLFVAHKCDLQAQSGPLLRPRRPDRPPLLDRLLGFGEISWRGTAAEMCLMERMCDVVFHGSHIEASSKRHSFDFPSWRDFIRRVAETKGDALVCCTPESP